jgi:hypothetical protein
VHPSRRLLRGCQLPGLGVGGGEEGHVVGAEQRVFVGVAAEDDFADLRLAALQRALDLVGLVQRAAGMHGDLELAGRGLVDVGGELVDVFSMEIRGRVTGGHVPLGLGRCGQGGETETECGGERAKAGFHQRIPHEKGTVKNGRREKRAAR